MNENNDLPETLQDTITYFADAHHALAFMVALRWPDGVVRCSRCQSSDVLFMTKWQKWRCRECKLQYGPKSGTIFEESPLSLSKWIPVVWVIVNAKNGVSSCELARSLGVTQKTAWFMLHRIRLAIQQGGLVRTMSGTVEVDESFIGGKARNMHHKAKVRRGLVDSTGAHASGKTAVMALLERGKGKEKASRVIAEVVPNVGKMELLPRVRKYVLEGSRLESDEHWGYQGAKGFFDHKVVNHAEANVQDGVHTNGLENFWSLLKRTLKGTYVSVEPFHLFRYLSEQVFRFNERKDEDGDRGRSSRQWQASSAND